MVIRKYDLDVRISRSGFYLLKIYVEKRGNRNYFIRLSGKFVLIFYLFFVLFFRIVGESFEVRSFFM